MNSTYLLPVKLLRSAYLVPTFLKLNPAYIGQFSLIAKLHNVVLNFTLALYLRATVRGDEN